ncbi:hypothetical protein HNQ07_004317 [Deinococcus metalli]|nr:hypothetical protein [Deinococcus metalli]MBB5378810.1 hypothetical protein [Deinococcus metalli]
MPPSSFDAWHSLVFRAAATPQAALAILDDPPASLTADQWARGQFWKACLQCQLGQTSAALRALSAVDEHGHWLPSIRLQDHDLDAIRTDLQFAALEQQWTARFHREAAHHRATLEIIEPSRAPGGTLVALHMNTGDPEQTRPLFSSLVDQGWRVALAGSGQYVGPGMAVWNDLAQADGELQEWARAVGGHPLWAGLSAGGSTVLRGVLTGGVPAVGVLAIVPSVAARPIWLPDRPVPVPVALILGEGDGYTPGGLKLAERLEEVGLQVRVWIHPGGHEVPAHWEELRAEALDWLGTSTP